MTRKELKQLIREVIEEIQTPQQFEVDGKQVDMETIEIDGIDRRDMPDFADAYIASAQFQDGSALNDNQLDKLNQLAYGWVNKTIHDKQLYM